MRSTAPPGAKFGKIKINLKPNLKCPLDIFFFFFFLKKRKPVYLGWFILLVQQATAMSNSAAEELMRKGAVVIQVLTPAERVHHAAAIAAAVTNAPELATPGKPALSDLCIGAFGAHGFSSTFHNPAVRELRGVVYNRAIAALFGPLCKLAQAENGIEYGVEQLIDRLCARTKPQPRESWHYDESPSKLKDDQIFGGWLNVGGTRSTFSHAPGTHRDVREGPGGFVPVADKAKYDAQRVGLVVEPGSMVVFYQTIVHEVNRGSATRSAVDFRLFIGWRLTTSSTPLSPNLWEQLEAQGCITLPSGQAVPMYAALHWTNWRSTLTAFSNNFRLECKTIRTVRSGARKGEHHCVVFRFLPSLKKMGLPMYPLYTAAEKAMHTPAKIKHD